MSVYVVTGKLGAGKSLIAVSRIRRYLLEGRRVATNLNLCVEYLLPVMTRRVDLLRVPDKPTAEDLQVLGLGAAVRDERRHGLLVLDELGSWLNSREWQDKARQGLIDWLIHSRKRRWDVCLIVQDVSLIDKQVRASLVEYLVTCKRLDEVPIPVIGRLGQLLTLGAWRGRVGRVHLGVCVYAAGAALASNALITDRWWYRGTALFRAYDTEQVFSSFYSDGVYSYRSPWDVVGQWLPRKLTWGERWCFLRRWLREYFAGLNPDRYVGALPKRELVYLLCRLQDRDARVRHWRRLAALGAFDIDGSIVGL